MSDNILIDIKKMIGLTTDDDSFDTDILININGTLTILHQLGVYIIDNAYVDNDSTWEAIFGENLNYRLLGLLRNYIYMKVRKNFDPPNSATAMDSLTKMIDEYEWRINVMVDPASNNVL